MRQAETVPQLLCLKAVQSVPCPAIQQVQSTLPLVLLTCHAVSMVRAAHLLVPTLD